MKELKEFMSQAHDIEEWNALRDLAKDKFGMALVSELDASGFIVEILNKE